MKRLVLAALATGLLALPATASTIPQADFYHSLRNFGISAGNDNLSVSLDVPITGDILFGGSINFPGIGVGTYQAIYDIRGMYRFLDGDRRGLSITGILGLWGNHYYSSSTYNTNVELGFGLAYPFTPRLVGRLNLLVPYYGTLPGPYYFTFGGPASGLEIAYQFNSKIEGSLGVNGQGGLLGLNILF